MPGIRCRRLCPAGSADLDERAAVGEGPRRGRRPRSDLHRCRVPALARSSGTRRGWGHGRTVDPRRARGCPELADLCPPRPRRPSAGSREYSAASFRAFRSAIVGYFASPSARSAHVPVPATSPIALGSKRRLVRIRPSRLYLQVAGLCRLDSWLSRSLDRQLTVKLNVNRRQWLSRISLMGRAVNVPVVSPLNGSLLRLLSMKAAIPLGWSALSGTKSGRSSYSVPLSVDARPLPQKTAQFMW